MEKSECNCEVNHPDTKAMQLLFELHLKKWKGFSWALFVFFFCLNECFCFHSCLCPEE